MLARLFGMRLFDIEASSRCNVSCVFCSREHLPETGLMDEDTFHRFLEHVPLRASDGLMFVGLGEPLLNPRLPDFIASAKRLYPKLFTLVTTNGKLLTAPVVSKLLEAGLDTLDVSFNGIDAKTYERLMKGARYEQTLANIAYTQREILCNKCSTNLQINYIVTQENADRKAEIEVFWRSRGIEHFRVQTMHTRGGSVGVDGMTPVGQPGLQGRSCEKFRFMPFITWRGDVVYCSHDLRRNQKIGNIRMEMWDDIEQRRKDVLQNHRWMDICEICVDSYRHELEKELSRGIIQEVKKRMPFSFKKTRTKNII